MTVPWVCGPRHGTIVHAQFGKPIGSGWWCIRCGASGITGGPPLPEDTRAALAAVCDATYRGERVEP